MVEYGHMIKIAITKHGVVMQYYSNKSGRKDSNIPHTHTFFNNFEGHEQALWNLEPHLKQMGYIY